MNVIIAKDMLEFKKANKILHNHACRLKFLNFYDILMVNIST